MKVFISGSISIKSLNKRNVAYIEQIIEGNCTVLIGDAYGIDKAVQEYLLQSGYPDVIVYFSGEKVRNNAGNWQVKQCLNPENLTGRDLYQLKDKAMAVDCDCGLMFWDGHSKGTKHNMDYMESLDKYFLVLCDGIPAVYNIHNRSNMLIL
ncbi:MAG: hypothetical protein LBS20_15545 [Prevotella sp.]|jgi:hypothetical protein|nr:hypothetical protein [Prevotella sp.]